MIYRFERRGRSFSTALSVLAVLVVILLLWVVLDLAIWIAAILAAFALPALWDLIRDPRGTLEVWPGRILWASTLGRGDATDIDHVRLNRRFDGTMKVTLVHVGGATTRLPPDIAAPVAQLEPALAKAGIATQRHPFSLI